MEFQKAFTHPNTLVTVHFHSHVNKRHFDSPKNITKQAIIRPTPRGSIMPYTYLLCKGVCYAIGFAQES